MPNGHCTYNWNSHFNGIPDPTARKGQINVPFLAKNAHEVKPTNKDANARFQKEVA